jgi:hypothetical protein
VSQLFCRSGSARQSARRNCQVSQPPCYAAVPDSQPEGVPGESTTLPEQQSQRVSQRSARCRGQPPYRSSRAMQTVSQEKLSCESNTLPEQQCQTVSQDECQVQEQQCQIASQEKKSTILQEQQSQLSQPLRSCARQSARRIAR